MFTVVGWCLGVIVGVGVRGGFGVGGSGVCMGREGGEEREGRWVF